MNACMDAQEEVISETSETEKVIHLTAIQKTKYGYGLGNGTVGVYDRSTREWRVKSKNKVCLGLCDLLGTCSSITCNLAHFGCTDEHQRC